ncbi:MAG TPA: glutamate--cysteine ligase [Alphaproteobacteria bacterium]|nr:glutamate--cysteine ligase [Alphaproteobacteria bacterium]
MSGPSTPSLEPIESKAQLVAYLEAGNKPRESWRIGTEHEKFAFRLADRARLPHEGKGGIGELLAGLTRFGWTLVREGEAVIGATREGGSVSLEPGGQVELSGAPLATIHQTCEEVHAHLAQVKELGNALGVGMLGLGFDPKWRRDEVPWMPKGRYKIMRAYMPKKGKLGLDMMLRTCTIQVNLDFASEADMAKKFRAGVALQPVATALFANSPFTEGKPNGYLSYRAHVWSDTDPDRCGNLPFVFEEGFGFERYVDWVLDVPMYFVYRDGRYIDAAGQSFRDFIAGRLPALPGAKATMGDWADHLTTAFPEVRLKRYLEMRGADGGPWKRICALPALWVGLLYDSSALDAAWDLVKDWSQEERAYLLAEVPKRALKTPFRNGTLMEVAREVLKIAEAGLKARAKDDGVGQDETAFLDTLQEIAASGTTPAEEMLAKFAGPWGGRIDPLYDEYAF